MLRVLAEFCQCLMHTIKPYNSRSVQLSNPQAVIESFPILEGFVLSMSSQAQTEAFTGLCVYTSNTKPQILPSQKAVSSVMVYRFIAYRHVSNKMWIDTQTTAFRFLLKSVLNNMKANRFPFFLGKGKSVKILPMSICICIFINVPEKEAEVMKLYICEGTCVPMGLCSSKQSFFFPNHDVIW